MKATDTKTIAAIQSLQPKGKEQRPFFPQGGGNIVFGSHHKTFFSANDGNSNATKLFFNSPIIQTKLSIDQPDDNYEQEADAMADQEIKNLSFGSVQRKCEACAAEDDEKGIAPKLQKKAIFESDEAPLKNQALRYNPISRIPAHPEMSDESIQKDASNDASTLPERVIGRSNTPLYAGPFDDILDIAPMSILPRGTRVRIIDAGSSTDNELVEVIDSAQRGYVSSFLDNQLMDTQEFQTLDALLNFNSGWHVQLPSSTLNAGSITYIRGSGHRNPRLSGAYPRSPQRQALASPEEEKNRSFLIDYIRGNLARIPVPTNTGDFRTARGGYVYTAGSQSHPASRQQDEFTDNMNLAQLGYNSPSRRVQGMWEQFRRVSRHEGDTSAINAWDDQIVTIGAGISARSGNAGSVYNRMPLQVRQNLYECGIRVNDDNSFSVLDLDRGVVETGENALRLIQVNPRLLAALIQVAQSQESMSMDGNNLTSQQWMARAQFEWFMNRNRNVPDAVFAWPREARQFAFLLGHWSGALSWAQMGATGGDVNRIAQYAFSTISRIKPDWTHDYIQRRIRNIARDAGVSEAISF